MLELRRTRFGRARHAGKHECSAECQPISDHAPENCGEHREHLVRQHLDLLAPGAATTQQERQMQLRQMAARLRCPQRGVQRIEGLYRCVYCCCRRFWVLDGVFAALRQLPAGLHHRIKFIFLDAQTVGVEESKKDAQLGETLLDVLCRSAGGRNERLALLVVQRVERGGIRLVAVRRDSILVETILIFAGNLRSHLRCSNADFLLASCRARGADIPVVLAAVRILQLRGHVYGTVLTQDGADADLNAGMGKLNNDGSELFTAGFHNWNRAFLLRIVCAVNRDRGSEARMATAAHHTWRKGYPPRSSRSAGGSTMPNRPRDTGQNRLRELR